MFYIIYQITNLVNGKIYIGKHVTDNPNDDYFGSGQMLKKAIEKYSKDAFSKDVLFIFDNEEEMNSKEVELVSEEFVKLKSNYNLCPGGQGGFGYLNKKFWTEEKRKQHNKKISNKNKNWSQRNLYKAREKLVELRENGYTSKNFLNKRHSRETKLKMSVSLLGKSTGEKNSQFGTMWITDGINNKKIKKDDPIPEGYRKGRYCSVSTVVSTHGR